MRGHIRVVYMFIIFLLWYTTGWSQSGWVDERRIEKHCIAGVSINDIAFEGKYLWCACRNGILRYDTHAGLSQQYAVQDSIHDMEITSVMVDHAGVKWFGTVSSGIFSFDGVTWRSYYPKVIYRPEMVRSIAEDMDNVKWFGTMGGIFRFDGDNWENIGGPYEQIMVDRDGNIWAAGELLMEYSRTDYQVLFYDQEVNYHSIVQDRNNVYWAGYDFGVRSYDGETFVEYSRYTGISGLSAVYDVAVDQSNTKWIASFGLWSFDGLRWIHHYRYERVCKSFCVNGGEMVYLKPTKNTGVQ